MIFPLPVRQRSVQLCRNPYLDWAQVFYCPNSLNIDSLMTYFAEPNHRALVFDLMQMITYGMDALTFNNKSVVESHNKPSTKFTS